MIKPKRLYTKIFLSFLAVLFVTELLIFILMIAIPAHRIGQRLEQFARERALIVEQLVEEMARTEPDTPLADNQALNRFVDAYGRLLEARLWISDTDQIVVVKSFPGPAPQIDVETAHWRMAPLGPHFAKNRHKQYYAEIPFDYGRRQSGLIHILFDNRGTPPPLHYFAIGLAMVGAVIALLVIPVSRPITRRINQLRRSTLRIADGDLGHRVAETGADEIAELANAFNLMTAKLESMINNSKELTANISHELRTPLARIQISVELLREKLENVSHNDTIRHLDDISEDINALDDLVGRILELSKLEMQAAPMVMNRMDLVEVLRDVIQKFNTAIARGHLQLDVSLPDGLPLPGNYEALTTVFSNLLDNAVKYSPSQGKIHIDAQTTAKGVQVTFSNTSEPLPQEALADIFNPFQRVHQFNLIGSPISGYGLGLAIVAKIIQAHGGMIKADNTPRGVAFSVHLPV